MASQAMQLFVDYMVSQDLKVQVLDEEERVARVGFNMENTDIEMIIHFSEDDTVVQVYGRDFVKIPSEKINEMYKVCNECNNAYRWVCFVVNEEDGQVLCKSDAEIQLDSCAEEIYNTVMRMANIVDNAYPKFMKALWG